MTKIIFAASMLLAAIWIFLTFIGMAFAGYGMGNPMRHREESGAIISALIGLDGLYVLSRSLLSLALIMCWPFCFGNPRSFRTLVKWLAIAVCVPFVLKAVITISVIAQFCWDRPWASKLNAFWEECGGELILVAYGLVIFAWLGLTRYMGKKSGLSWEKTSPASSSTTPAEAANLTARC